MGKALLKLMGIAGGSYALSLVLSFLLIVGTAVMTERWRGARMETAMLFLLIAICLIFLLGALVVAFGAWRLLPTVLARLGVIVGYVVVAVPTVLLIAFLSLVVFNR
jgi:hypothetical protein